MAQPKGAANTAFKHGFAVKGKRPAIYWQWRHIIARCYEPKDKDYGRYGARGITVCDRWHYGEGGVSGFVLWMQDMGPRPFPGATIDRKDGTKGYTPDNCRWASIHEQANNKRTNVLLTARGQTMTIAQWARVVGIGPKTIGYRIKQGASPEEAIFKTPNHGTKLTTKRARYDEAIRT
jgi:hypothetical protein